jgi:hypothetical protein
VRNVLAEDGTQEVEVPAHLREASSLSDSRMIDISAQPAEFVTLVGGGCGR